MANAREQFCLIDDRSHGSLYFVAPRRIVAAFAAEEVAPALAALQQASRENLWAAGYVAYECGAALEPRLKPLLGAAKTPLLKFGLFDAPSAPPAAPVAPQAPAIADLRPLWSFEDYRRRFEACRDYIAAGDVYQVNLAFPLAGRFAGDPVKLYESLRRRQPVEIGGIVALGGETILSLSPEKFFSIAGRRIVTRPMKGTAPRGKTPDDDRILAAQLAVDEKNRAENLMIVDLLRNDLSRLSEVGSVTVTDLFSVEAFPTLHQMTSGVEALLRPGLSFGEIFTGLFPCGSVTGAPKIRAMEIIAEQEGLCRGVYCGAVGVIAPGGDMRFNVAIRTLTLGEDGGLICPVGSAIVADSRAREEYDECLLKARFLTTSA
ncbi:aminodeoxychorismate synthase, component I [Rhodoblastus sphagnicola]|uniref:Aminodeoxychorismate synthase, component I n=1 Tax=Rhodoblastus sphagnicola TaxID=333368 RepID=A0A2S6N939_9HYPH|nr:aminodeoxychorismate synthase component I [Rhodoblastus sphagnicola]MBB4196891.1 aminodeoxychorismate synthase component I [Rhodoblastus sphagnicola]PPQ31111.1 aminodeoxychorismate synthase, component I [Rhodoblastus sphagnicola]